MGNCFSQSKMKANHGARRWAAAGTARRDDALIVLALLLTATAAMAGPIAWRGDVDRALDEARSTGKLVLVNIHTAWCGPCRRLQATTLQDVGLASLIEENCIPVSLDGDTAAVQIAQWGVEAFPTQILLSPHGQVVGRITGYVTAAEYAGAIRRAVTTLGVAQRPAPKLLPPSTLGTELTPNLAKDPAASETRNDPLVRPCDMSVPLALDGYCPVTMIRKAELVPGTDEECIVYKGKRYHFLSAAERTMFLDNPGKFLPAEDGRCVVTWHEQHKWIAGQVTFPAIFGDQVYLFPSDETRHKFLVDPEKYVDARGRVKIPPVENARRPSILR